MGAAVGATVGAFVGETVGGTAVGGTAVGGTATGAVVGGTVVAVPQALSKGRVVNDRINKAAISFVFIFVSFYDRALSESPRRPNS